MKSRIIIVVTLLGIIFLCCKTGNDFTRSKTKSYHKSLVKGFNFTGTSYEMTDFSTFSELKEIGSNWVSFSPFCYMINGKEGEVIDTFPRQWVGESVKGVSTYIDEAKKRGLKVLINPHIWVVDGTFTGDLKLNREERAVWQKSYSSYLLKWASTCEAKGVEMLSLGNELKTPVAQDKDYWYSLIKAIRKVYSGRLTYASNWDNVEQIPFWQELDVVSVNAYFPLSTARNPSEKEITAGWTKWVKVLTDLKEIYAKPVVFTELGYQTKTHCCAEPWDYTTSYEEDERCQELAFKAFFEVVLGSKSCDGVFIWKWYDKHDKHKHDSYSPQGKSAMKVIKNAFSGNKN